MIPPPFRYLRPRTLDEALTLLVEEDGAVALAGGQTLVNALKLDLVSPGALVDIHRLPELRGVEEVDGALRIGAAVTYAELATHPLVLESVPALARVAAGLVDRQVRNRGTIGGNCCLNDPANNLPPLLAALGATFELLREGAAPRGLSSEEFFLDTLVTAAGGGALLAAVSVPVQQLGTRIAYRHQQVGADSWALARAVVRLDLDDDVITSSRVYLGAIPHSPLRLPGVEAVLDNARREPATTASALDAFDGAEIDTVGDSHGSAAYRLAMARVQLKRALGEAIAVPDQHEEEAA